MGAIFNISNQSCVLVRTGRRCFVNLCWLVPTKTISIRFNSPALLSLVVGVALSKRMFIILNVFICKFTKTNCQGKVKLGKFPSPGKLGEVKTKPWGNIIDASPDNLN